MTWCLSLSVWLVAFSIIPTKLICVVANGDTKFASISVPTSLYSFSASFLGLSSSSQTLNKEWLTSELRVWVSLFPLLCYLSQIHGFLIHKNAHNSKIYTKFIMHRSTKLPISKLVYPVAFFPSPLWSLIGLWNSVHPQVKVINICFNLLFP